MGTGERGEIEEWHGTLNGYINKKCRCQECRYALYEYYCEAGVIELWHGTLSGYTNKKCRCEECQSAWTSYYYEYVKPKRERDREYLVKLGLRPPVIPKPRERKAVK